MEVFMSESHKKLGEVGWDEIDVATQGEGGKSNDSIFLNMGKEGNYKIRVVSRPYQYYCHWIETKSGKRRKVNATLDGTDPICLQENKGPQLKWLLKVLYRDPQKGTQLKVLDAGTQIMAQIQRLHKDKENFGNVSKYDIILTRGPKNARPLYTVQATGSEKFAQPMTAEEVQMVKDSGNPDSKGCFVNIEKMCEPWSAQRIMSVINEEDPSKAKDKASIEEPLLDDQSDDKDFLDLDV
jgi:hypothetical protein